MSGGDACEETLSSVTLALNAGRSGVVFWIGLAALVTGLGLVISSKKSRLEALARGCRDLAAAPRREIPLRPVAHSRQSDQRGHYQRDDAADARNPFLGGADGDGGRGRYSRL